MCKYILTHCSLSLRGSTSQNNIVFSRSPMEYATSLGSQFIQSLVTDKIFLRQRTMSDDRNVLLEEDSYKVIEVECLPVNISVQPVENNNDFEISTEDHRPYRFLQNCNSVALWICVFYNLCMILLLICLFVHKRIN